MPLPLLPLRPGEPAVDAETKEALQQRMQQSGLDPQAADTCLPADLGQWQAEALIMTLIVACNHADFVTAELLDQLGDEQIELNQLTASAINRYTVGGSLAAVLGVSHLM